MNIKIIAIFTIMFWYTISAHDTGFSHTNRTMFFKLDEQSITIEYRIKVPYDQAWIEMAGMDKDKNGEISEQEKSAYFTLKAAEIIKNLELTSGRESLKIEFAGYSIDSSFSQTFMFKSSAGCEAILLDRNFQGRPGSVRLLADKKTALTVQNKVDINHAETVKILIGRKSEK